MVLFALTNITLDVTLGVSWWLIRNTVYGTYCLGNYLFCNPPKNEKLDDILELKYQITELNKKLERINSSHELLTEQIKEQSNIIQKEDESFEIIDQTP